MVSSFRLGGGQRPPSRFVFHLPNTKYHNFEKKQPKTAEKSGCGIEKREMRGYFIQTGNKNAAGLYSAQLFFLNRV